MKRNVSRNTMILTIGLVVALLVVAGGYLALISPQRKKASDLQTSIATTQQQLSVALAASHQRKGPSENARVSDLFRLGRAMPDQIDMPGIILQLDRLAHQVGVTLESIQPGTATPAASGGYETVPITVEFQGDFDKVSSLLARLRHAVSVHGGRLSATGRLFEPSSVEFAEGSDGFPKVDATLTLNAFVFTPPPPSTTTTTTTTPSSGSVSAAGATG